MQIEYLLFALALAVFSVIFFVHYRKMSRLEMQLDRLMERPSYLSACIRAANTDEEIVACVRKIMTGEE